jgi:hypothetical protein
MRLFTAMAFMFLAVQSARAAEGPVRINEFAAGGRQGLTDEDGDSPDWIEMHNASSQGTNLSGWTFKLREKEWRFPATNLAAGEFLILFASGKDRRVPGQALHTNFKLPADGGTLVLEAANGDGSSTSKYPPQVPGISFGRTEEKVEATPGKGRSTSFAYLRSPTPGRTNSPAVALGPHILSLSHEPSVPKANEGVLVRAKVAESSAKVAKVSLRYRIMFERERELEMHDDGQHSDGAADDGLYAAAIPAGRAKAGEMIRYCVQAQDEQARASRWPLFAKNSNYSAYEGTVVADPSIQSRLPIVHLFDPGNGPMMGLGRQAATGFVLFVNGELYDNVFVSAHGQISRGFPKPSFNLKFPRDRRFRYRQNEPRVSEVKILGNFADKSKIRNTLAYEMIAACGSIAHFAFPVRIQQNGEFLCIAEMIEDGDDRWLERAGRDPEGALYKMNSSLMPGSEAEKKTRKSENVRDLSRFAAAIGEHRPLFERAGYAYDHIDIPQCISYFVAMALISSGDHGHKNYYLYCDTRGSGEWALLPWDVDLSWGRNWMKTYFDDRIYVDNPLSLYRAGRDGRARNPIYNLFFDHAEFRQMYLRRLRTVMDELLQAPETPPEDLIIEKRIQELMDLIDPDDFRQSDADLDSARWPAWEPNRSARAEAGRIMKQYLPGRRNFLFKNGRATLQGDAIPASQPQDAAIHFYQVENGHASTEQFVCLTNRNRFAVDVSGWKLSGSGIEHQCRPGTVIPGGKALYVVSNVSRFRRREQSPRGGEAHFVQGNWKGTFQKQGTLRLSDETGRLVHTMKVPLERN